MNYNISKTLVRETKNFSETVASLFHITQKVRMTQALFFLNLNKATEQLKTGKKTSEIEKLKTLLAGELVSP